MNWLLKELFHSIMSFITYKRKRDNSSHCPTWNSSWIEPKHAGLTPSILCESGVRNKLTLAQSQQRVCMCVFYMCGSVCVCAVFQQFQPPICDVILTVGFSLTPIKLPHYPSSFWKHLLYHYVHACGKIHTNKCKSVLLLQKSLKSWLVRNSFGCWEVSKQRCY